MEMTENAGKYLEKMSQGWLDELAASDPEFTERLANFAFDEVVNEDDLDDKTRSMAILAALMGCQGIDLFAEMLEAAMNFGVSAQEIREIVYQGTDYLGIGRVLPFIRAMNSFFEQKGISLPLAPAATTTMETRREAGTAAQMEIFGEGMKDFYQSGPAETVHINRWLAANCFGDYYTRKGLDLAQREMVTFCYIAAQGGCQPQLIAHAGGNMKMGNDRGFLIKIISQCLPYIGYPRSLNAINAVNEAAGK
jgi:4-carboxymuconolactone decarboxylase